MQGETATETFASTTESLPPTSLYFLVRRYPLLVFQIQKMKFVMSGDIWSPSDNYFGPLCPRSPSKPQCWRTTKVLCAASSPLAFGLVVVEHITATVQVVPQDFLLEIITTENRTVARYHGGFKQNNVGCTRQEQDINQAQEQERHVFILEYRKTINRRIEGGTKMSTRRKSHAKAKLQNDDDDVHACGKLEEQ